MRRARLESPQGIIVVSQDPTGVFFASSPPKRSSLSLPLCSKGSLHTFRDSFPDPLPSSTNLPPIFVDIAFHSVASHEAGERGGLVFLELPVNILVQLGKQ